MGFTKEIALLGGDERQIYMARSLARMGYCVRVWGLGDVTARVSPAHLFEDWRDALGDCGVVVLPLPATTDGVRLFAPACGDGGLRLSALLGASRGRILLGGKISPELRRSAEAKEIRVSDYFGKEELQLKNALPTAEGAVAIAMRELPVMLDGCRAAVVGYGRIGEVLTDKLIALGAEVTVYARRTEVLTRASLRHAKTVRLTECPPSPLSKLDPDTRVVFNTVPQWLFTEEVLRTVPKDCVLIDLASSPGGIDRAAAERLGVRNVWGTALPGKCVPESAGVILAETVAEMLGEAIIR